MQGTEKPDLFKIYELARRLNRTIKSIEGCIYRKDWSRIPPPIEDPGTAKNSPREWSENVYRLWLAKREEGALRKLRENIPTRRGRPRLNP